MDHTLQSCKRFKKWAQYNKRVHGKSLESGIKCYHSFKEEDMTFNRKEKVAFILKYKTIEVTKTQHNRLY